MDVNLMALRLARQIAYLDRPWSDHMDGSGEIWIDWEDVLLERIGDNLDHLSKEQAETAIDALLAHPAIRGAFRELQETVEEASREASDYYSAQHSSYSAMHYYGLRQSDFI